jgi:hypothetical protein
METEMKEIIITALATFIFTFGLVVNLESRVKAEKVKSGFIIIDSQAYLLTKVRAPQ